MIDGTKQAFSLDDNIYVWKFGWALHKPFIHGGVSIAEPHKGYGAERVRSSAAYIAKGFVLGVWKIWSSQQPAPLKDTLEVLYL